jgi:RNA polymerase-binding protein DksA
MAKATRTSSGRSGAKLQPPARAQAPVKAKTSAAAKTTKTVKPSKAAKSVKAAKTTKTVKPSKTVKTVKKTPAKAAPAKSTKKAAGSVKAVSVKAGPAKAVSIKAVSIKAAAKKAPAKAATKATKAAAKPAAKAAKAVPASKAVKTKVVKGPPALVPKPAPSRPVLSEVVARKHRTPAVAPSTLERLKIQLVEEHDQHIRQMEGLQAEAEALANEREPGDTQFDEESGEGDTLSVERERDLALSTAARQTLDDIAKALARIDDGSYGYCEVCGDRIPVPRLEAIPWADQCVKCKSRGERRR